MKTIRVTEALSPFCDFSMIRPEVLEAAAARGTAIHSYCTAYAQGLWAPLPLNGDGYCESFKRWMGLYVAEVYFAEVELTDPLLGFTGHPDLGVKLTDGRRVIVDIKTPATEQKTWKAQIAAYKHLASREYPEIGFTGGMSLRLSKDGLSAKGTVYESGPEDFAAFLSALNCFRYFKS